MYVFDEHGITCWGHSQVYISEHGNAIDHSQMSYNNSLCCGTAAAPHFQMILLTIGPRLGAL